MGVSFQIDEDRVELAVVGPATAAEVLDQLQAAFVHPDLSVPLRLVIDVTESELVPESGDMRRIAELIGTVPSSRVAVLVAQKVRYGLARQFGAYLDGHGIPARPFWDRAEAATWLRGSE